MPNRLRVSHVIRLWTGFSVYQSGAFSEHSIGFMTWNLHRVLAWLHTEGWNTRTEFAFSESLIDFIRRRKGYLYTVLYCTVHGCSQNFIIVKYPRSVHSTGKIGCDIKNQETTL